MAQDVLSPAPTLPLPPGLDITRAERRLAASPTRSARIGALTWGGVGVFQRSDVTCGALVLVLLAALGDPVLALWLQTGRRAGSLSPPELAGLTREELATAGVAERLALAERVWHERARRGALLPWPCRGLDWPAGLGTPPWALARTARFPGISYTHTVVDDQDVAATRAVLTTVRAATRRGIPVPLFTGGDLGTSIASAVPRHVVLALPYRGRDERLRIFEPGEGRIHALPLERLVDRRRPARALGGWSHVDWAVLPSSAYRSAR